MWSRFQVRARSFKLVVFATISLCVVFFAAPRIINLASHEEVILLTAFEPFGGRKINSSWEVIRRFEGKKINGRRIVTVRLPVVWATAWTPVQTAIDRYQPSLVINVGQGATGQLELDQSARNVVGKILDNAGVRPTTEVITADGPAHYDTRLDLAAINNRLAQNGYKAIMSPHAGTYLCNFVSYHSYEYLAHSYPKTATLFVHVPVVATTDVPEDQIKLNQLTDALQLIVETASQQVSELAASRLMVALP